MICPNCRQNVLRRERTSRVCGKCRKPFALEPKESALGMHDVRVHTLAGKFADGRGLRYTLPQMYYAAGRKHLPDLRLRFIGRRALVTVPIVVVTVVLSATMVFPPAIVLVVGLGVLVLAHLWLTAYRPKYMRTRPVRLPIEYSAFESQVLGGWVRVYGGPPPGSVAAAISLPPPPPNPRFAVLCPDLAVLSCLAANDVGDGTAALARGLDRLPPHVPVLVLHDASVAGVLFAADARAALGARAVPVGIRPRDVIGKPRPMRLRHGHPSPDELARLRTLPLTEEEQIWLEEGWWSPLAAVPPAKLLTAVERALRRGEEAIDPDARRARSVGFLTWPVA